MICFSMSGERKERELAGEKTREEIHSLPLAPCLNCLIATKGSHGMELLSTARLAIIPVNECTSGAR